jgi:hypothetical protein
MLHAEPESKPAPHDVPKDAIPTVVNHIRRYRLSVFNAIERLPVFTKCGARQVKQVLAECRRQSVIDSSPLHQGAKYWYLNTNGVAQSATTNHQTGPLSEPAKLHALAILRFCCLSERPRHRLTANELRDRFPDIDRPGLPDGYYFDPQNDGRIGLVRLDAGRRGRWDRIVQSLRNDISVHLRSPGFQRLIQADRFEITVITVFRQKAQRIREALMQHSDAQRVLLRIVAMPELLPLLSTRR